MSELKSTVESLRAQCAAAQTATVSAKAAQEELQGRLEDAAREVQRERDASHAVIIAERSHSSKLQQLQHRLDDASEQLLAAEATKLADQKALLAERSKRAAAEEASQRLSDELDLLKSQAKSYSSQLADQQAILADVRRRHKDELAAVNRHLDAEREHARNCEDQLNAAAQDATLHAQQVKRISSELEDAKVCRCVFHPDDDVTAVLSFAQSVSQQLEQRLLQSKAELEKNAKRFLVVDKQKSEADGHIGALSDRVRVAEAAADAARAEVQALNGKFRSSSNTAQALRTELDALKQTSSASAKGRTELEVILFLFMIWLLLSWAASSQTELSKCWASRTVAEARVSDLTADVEDKRARIVSLEASVADLQKMVDFQAATIEKLKKDGEFNNENATLFKSEQERCLALMAELHGLQAQASADADALALARQELASLSSSEQRKVVSLKVWCGHCLLTLLPYNTSTPLLFSQSALNAMKSELDAQLTSTAQLKNECADLQQQLSAARSLAATQVDSLKQDVHQWRLAGQAVVKNVQNCIADLESSTGFDLKRARAMMPVCVNPSAALFKVFLSIVVLVF